MPERSRSIVSLARCDRYDPRTIAAAVRSAIDSIGGIEKYVSPGSRVLVKPNLLLGLPPERGVTTHPLVIGAVVSLLSGIGCSVVIADSPGGGIRYTPGSLASVYRAAGYEPVAAQTGAALNFDTSFRVLKYPDGKITKSFPVISPAIDADHIVVVSKPKTHVWTLFSGGAKNLFGVVPGREKPLFHARFQDPRHFGSMIVDLNRLVAPSLQVMDAIVGMEGDGPSAGSPREIGMVLASPDPFGLDVVACRMIGIPPADVPVNSEAMDRGLLPGDPDSIPLVGDVPAGFPLVRFRYPSNYLGAGGGMRKNLLLAALHKLGGLYALYPSFDAAACRSCGRCQEICPGGALRLEGGRPVLDRSSCIRCYCCHEICPEGAVSLRPGPGRKIVGRIAGLDQTWP